MKLLLSFQSYKSGTADSEMKQDHSATKKTKLKDALETRTEFCNE